MKQPVTKKPFKTCSPSTLSCPPGRKRKWRAASPSAPFSITQSRAMGRTIFPIYYPVIATTYPDYRIPPTAGQAEIRSFPEGFDFFHWIKSPPTWEYWAAMLMQCTSSSEAFEFRPFDVLLLNPRGLAALYVHDKAHRPREPGTNHATENHSPRKSRQSDLPSCIEPT
jgi:hypothetical protein